MMRQAEVLAKIHGAWVGSKRADPRKSVYRENWTIMNPVACGNGQFEWIGDGAIWLSQAGAFDAVEEKFGPHVIVTKIQHGSDKFPTIDYLIVREILA